MRVGLLPEVRDPVLQVHQLGNRCLAHVQQLAPLVAVEGGHLARALKLHDAAGVRANQVHVHAGVAVLGIVQVQQQVVALLSGTKTLGEVATEEGQPSADNETQPETT